MLPRLCTLVVVAALTAVPAGCSPTDGAGTPTDGDEPAPETAAATEASLEVPLSRGTLRIGDETAGLEATCVAPGAGEVLVAAVGVLEPSRRPVEVYFQAFLAEPYIAVEVGDSTGDTELLEASLDDRLEVFITDDRVAAGAIRFVRDLDLTTGTGEFVGFGSIDVVCAGYARRLPG